MLKKTKEFIKGVPVLGKGIVWAYHVLAIHLYRAAMFVRLQKPLTKLLGPCYARSRDEIEIDVTYRCTLKCANCNRSCTQAPSADQITVEQVRQFTEDSIAKNIRWRAIRVVGGEPTLHPDLNTILGCLLDYRKKFSPETKVSLFTNGYGKSVNALLAKIPPSVEIVNSQKTSSHQYFHPFNTAPKDLLRYRFADYSNGCCALELCGLGLTPYGYYPCPQGGGIDRVFGFNIGRKALPEADDTMKDQLKILCGFCGYFMPQQKQVCEQKSSHSWIKAYEKFKRKRSDVQRS